MTFSINDHIVTEPYVKDGLKARVQNGIATPGQRDGVKGLRVLMSTTLSSGQHVPKGSMAYIKEEVLHNHAFASKPLNCDTIKGGFIIVDKQFIEWFDIPEESA